MNTSIDHPKLVGATRLRQLLGLLSRRKSISKGIYGSEQGSIGDFTRPGTWRSWRFKRRYVLFGHTAKRRAEARIAVRRGLLRADQV